MRVDWLNTGYIVLRTGQGTDGALVQTICRVGWIELGLLCAIELIVDREAVYRTVHEHGLGGINTGTVYGDR